MFGLFWVALLYDYNNDLFAACLIVRYAHTRHHKGGIEIAKINLQAVRFVRFVPVTQLATGDQMMAKARIVIMELGLNRPCLHESTQSPA